MPRRQRIAGYFRWDPHGARWPPRPFVTARVHLFRFGRDREVRLLVDTGADRTMIHPADSLRLVPDLGLLERSEESLGVGGVARMFVEDGALVFVTTDQSRVFVPVQLRVAEPTPHNQHLPSLLGRDVLGGFRLVVDQRRGEILLER